LVAADPVAIPLLRRFREVIVEDSSTFALPDELKEHWPGCADAERSGTQAAFKIQVRWDLLTGGLLGLGLQAGKQSDQRSPFKGQSRGAKSVRIADLGYFDTQEFQREGVAGEYFLSRLKVGVLKLFTKEGEPLELLALLQEKATGGSYECEVQVGASTRLPVRLLAIPVPEASLIKRQADLKRKAQKHGRKPNPLLLDLAQWTLLIANIAQEELSIVEAVVLLRLRWQVELLFKLWKQEMGLDVSRSQQPWHVLCDCYAKLLGALIVHWLFLASCWQVPSRSMVKASQAIRRQIVLVAKALGGKLDLHWVLCEMLEGLDACRMNSRRKDPNAYQLLLAAEPLLTTPLARLPDGLT
jgi:Transposase DDE domain